jgi:hypothetical protein
MDMQIALAKHVVLDAELRGARSNVRVRGVDRLAHDVAQLAGDRKAPGARHLERFDQHDIAAGGRPREPGDDADFGHLFGFLGRIARNAEHFLDLVDVDDPGAFLAVGLGARPLPHDRRQIAFKVS